MRGDFLFESHSLAYLVNKSTQPWHFLHVVLQHDTLTHFHVTLQPDILYGHHSQVVALFSVAHELMDSFGHLGNNLAGFLLLVGQCKSCYVVDTLHLELGVVDIHCLSESVGEEEDGGAGEYLCLL